MTAGQVIVESEVRELIRQRGINPLAEVEAVNRLIAEVTSDYLDRGSLPESTRPPTIRGL